MSFRGVAIAATAALTSFFLAGGCSQELRARSALELMDDPLVLEAVVTRCQDLHEAALEDEECRNAREAVDRLAAQKVEPAPVESDPGFERAREERRAREEEERERQRNEEQQQVVDPYTMPLVKDPVPEPADVTASSSDASRIDESTT